MVEYVSGDEKLEADSQGNSQREEEEEEESYVTKVMCYHSNV